MAPSPSHPGGRPPSLACLNSSERILGGGLGSTGGRSLGLVSLTGAGFGVSGFVPSGFGVSGLVPSGFGVSGLVPSGALPGGVDGKTTTWLVDGGKLGWKKPEPTSRAPAPRTVATKSPAARIRTPLGKLRRRIGASSFGKFCGARPVAAAGRATCVAAGAAAVL